MVQSKVTKTILLVISLFKQLQELGVAHSLCQLQRCDFFFIWHVDRHQTTWLAQQQLGQPIQTPSYSQVEGGLPVTMHWRQGQKVMGSDYNNISHRIAP